MTIKRLLILFILVTYSVVGCAGANRAAKPDGPPGDIEKDREECMQSIDKNGYHTFTDCLAKKGYKLKSNQKLSEWWSKHREEILVSINPYVLADVILTIPIVLTIKLVQ
jgi:hypothetical protein